MAPMELEEMLEKYSQRQGHSQDGSDVQNQRVPCAPEELDAYWEQSIYRKDQEVLEMFGQARGETMTESDGLSLLGVIVLRRDIKQLMGVIQDGFKDLCKVLEQDKKG